MENQEPFPFNFQSSLTDLPWNFFDQTQPAVNFPSLQQTQPTQTQQFQNEEEVGWPNPPKNPWSHPYQIHQSQPLPQYQASFPSLHSYQQKSVPQIPTAFGQQDPSQFLFHPLSLSHQQLNPHF